MRNKWQRAAIAAMALIASGAALFAQSNYGSITGVVKDGSGSSVPNAVVRVTDLGTNAAITVHTDESGVYSLPSLRPVSYSVAVSATGFQSVKVDNVKVDTSKTSSVDVMLRPGTLSETITVSAAGGVLETGTGAVAQTITERTMTDMPLNGRNVIELALTMPGVTGDAGSEIGSPFNTPPIPGREISVNGARGGSTQFTADGMNITSVGLARTSISFSPDTIQEFSILQSNYSAQYSVAGGGIIQQTTKSGTNDIHGTAFWFHRQRFLSANPFNSTRQPQLNNDNRPPLRRQQLGLVIGGPVDIPKIYHGRNKTFFLATYEPLRQLSGGTGGANFVRVPTPQEIQGDFSNSYTYDSAGVQRLYPLLYNHFTQDSSGVLHYMANSNYNPSLPVSAQNPLYAYTFNNNLFNPGGTGNALGRILVGPNGKSLVNPVSQKIAQALFPAPMFPMITSGANAGSNYAYFTKTDNNDNRYTGRIDHYLSDTQRFFARYTYQPLYADRFGTSLTGNPYTSDTSLSNNVLISLNSTLKPTLVNEFRAGGTWSNFSRNFPSNYLNTDGTTPLLDIGGAGKGTPNPNGFGLANFMKKYSAANNQTGWVEIGQDGVQNVGRNSEASYSISNALHWVHGNQTWHFGVDAYQQQSNAAAAGYGYMSGGVFTESGTVTADAVGCTQSVASGSTALPSDCHAATARTGDNFASFLLGVPGNPLMYDNIASPYYYRWANVGAYAQNDWKVKSNLTINIGVRWQFQTPRWEKYNRQGQLDLNDQVANPYVLSATGSPLPSPVFKYAGVAGRSRYLSPVHWADFEPRFGFAWTPEFGWNSGHKWVLRGGFGISHSPLTGNGRLPFPNLGSKLDAFRSYNVVYGTTSVFNPGNVGGCGLAICQSDIPMQFGYNNIQYSPDPTLWNIPTSGEIRPSDVAPNSLPGIPVQDKRYSTTGWVFDQNSRNPYAESFSLQVQRQLPQDTVLIAGYQGSHGIHLFSADMDVNNNPITGVKAYPGFNGTQGGRIMMLNRTGSTSTYNALVVQLNRRFSKGLQVNFNYTFSKSMDDSSGGIQYDYANLSGQDSSAQVVPINQPQNSGGRTSERAVSNFNVPHVFNLTGFWELPMGRGRKLLNHGGLMNLIFGGYQISWLGRYQSGLPLFTNLGTSNNINLTATTGLSNPRPDLTPGVPLINPEWTRDNATYTSYLNPRAFAVPTPGTFGNAARNFSVYGPFRRTLDVSIFKDISLGHETKRRIQLRGEFYNVFNMKNFTLDGGVSTNLFSGLNQNVLGQPNRYANLTPAVWTAILHKDPSSLSGAASTTTPAGGVLSPLGVYQELSGYYNGNLYLLNQNTTLPRMIQLGLKFYF